MRVMLVVSPSWTMRLTALRIDMRLSTDLASGSSFPAQVGFDAFKKCVHHSFKVCVLIDFVERQRARIDSGGIDQVVTELEFQKLSQESLKFLEPVETGIRIW